MIFVTSCNAQEVTKIINSERETSYSSDLTKITIHSSGIKKIFEFTPEMSDSYYYVPLETTENSIIGNIDRVLRHDDRIFILDREKARSVFCFDGSGNFLFRLGKLGRGPGEYPDLLDMVLDPIANHIGILGEDVIIWYNIQDGIYSGQDTKFDNFMVDRVSMYDSNTLIGYANNQCFSKKYCSNFYRFTKDGNVIDQYMPIKNDEKDLYVEYETPFSGGIYSSSFTHFLNDSIYVINEKNEMVPKYVVDYSDMAPTDRSNLPRNSKKYGDWIKKSVLEESVVGFESYHETNDIIHFKFRKGSSLIWNLYFKDTEKLITAQLSIGNEVFITNLIVGEYLDYFISFVPEHLLLQLNEILENSGEEVAENFKGILGQEFYDHIMSIDGIANPVLAFYTLRAD